MKWSFGVVVLLLFASCAGGRKLHQVMESAVKVDIAAGSLDDVLEDVVDVVQDTAQVQTVEIKDLHGNMIIMNAVKDEQTGEMVAQELLEEIVVQAKFSNVAERNGVVDLVFELAVPLELQHTLWQVRLYPDFAYLGDTLRSDGIYITGEKFRKVQQWEYRMYDNYLSRVVPEDKTGKFYDMEVLRSRFQLRHGDEADAGNYYRKKISEKMNRRREEAKLKVYNQFVVDPYPTSGVRLDTVTKGEDKVHYFYVQTIPAKAGLRKVEMVLNGEVYTNGRKLCDIASSSPITFYISSISTLADQTKRYLKKVVYRDLHFDASYNIAFAKGQWQIDSKLGDNASVMSDIKRNFAQVFSNDDFVVDSILVAAACSPEGKYSVNNRLSKQRGETIKGFLLQNIKFAQDSVSNDVWELGSAEVIDGEAEHPNSVFDPNCIKISEVSEDWEELYRLISYDTVLAGKGILEKCSAVDDPDAREAVLLAHAGADVKNSIYPRLRRVKFNFKLHRKGMLKDTVHTTELDTAYMRGVEALCNRDYKTAVTLLRPYRCYNSAVAYICMGYDHSALEILQTLPKSARRDYMLAVVYGRLGDEKNAVEYFVNSVQQDESMRHRGNLDPEISALIKKYKIFNN